ncbi:hypothetical protein [Bosea vaviloviae]|uniref:Uncharacterized protein n=1 Tax=Bosea vaviloviae TaxID=1526658 RepID=A0A0N1F4Z0_9HYPH|nr:hypothetical protein [Bosea vaviloviae]KPH80541.1 hypothetical protein AE618_12255 [Bosea vaviloviae]
MSQERLDIQEAAEAAFVGLTYGLAGLAMQVFKLSNTVPIEDDDIRRLLKRLAPFASGHVIDGAFMAVKAALDEVVVLEKKVGGSH